MIKDSVQEFYKSLKENRPILGVDYGLKKVGFAITDPMQKMSMPLEVKVFAKEDIKTTYIMELIGKYDICGIIVGLPLNMDGTESDQSKKVRIFASKLGEAASLPVYMQDERLSSFAAQSLLKSMGMKRKARDNMDDQISASLILENAIDAIARLSC